MTSLSQQRTPWGGKGAAVVAGPCVDSSWPGSTHPPRPAQVQRGVTQLAVPHPQPAIPVHGEVLEGLPRYPRLADISGGLLSTFKQVHLVRLLRIL